MDTLVYATPFKIGNEGWGYKWIGVCSGKRFAVVLNPYAKEMYCSEKLYVICDQEQCKNLPEQIQKTIHLQPLSNEYFMSGNMRDFYADMLVQIIEKGYNIHDITLQKGKYIKESTGEVIAEISWKWKGAM